MIQVVNIKHHGKDDYKLLKDGVLVHYVYCGRPSKYGNPFVLKSEADRAKVINKFAVNTLPDLNLSELIECAKAGDLLLGCYCSPKPCHCDKIKQEIERQL